MKSANGEKRQSFILKFIVASLLLISGSAGANVLAQASSMQFGDEDIERLTSSGRFSSIAEIRAEKAARSRELVSLRLPSVIDTTGFMQRAKVNSSDQGPGTDFYGFSVAAEGDTAVVGAYYEDVGDKFNQGAVYVYVRSGANWILQTKLTAADGEESDLFGIRVGISGDTLVVGAVGDDLPPGFNQGSAYIFTRSGTAWTQQAKLIASDGGSGDRFGFSADVDGNTAIVGAVGDCVGNLCSAGSAFIFTRSGASWTQQAKLTASDATAYDEFGYSVALEGNSAVVGAWGAFIPPGNAEQGAAYVFVRSGAAWSQQAKLRPLEANVTQTMGRMVAISGDTVAVTDNLARVGANRDQGSAWIFVRSGATWTQQARLTHSDGVPSDQLGYGLTLDGNTAVVSAGCIDVESNQSQGAAYVFTRSGTAWTQMRKLTAADGVTYDLFGDAVAMSGNNLVVGAPRENVSFGINKGFAYIFEKISVAPAKPPFDFDGDNKSDVSVFRPAGGVWHLLRSNAGYTGIVWGTDTDKIVPADYDGDGKTDVAVYRPSTGVWYVLQSSNNAVLAVQFGAAEDLPRPADYDGDGKADVAVFRPSNGIWYRLNSSNNQAVGIQFGASGDVPVPADFDGDGRADVNVFRPSNGIWYRLNSSDNSLTSVRFGAPSDVPTAADYDGDNKADIAVFRPSDGTWYRLNSSNSQLVSVQWGTAGDVPAAADYDGDGKADLAVFRAGDWYLRQTTAGFATVRFGTSSDKPLPAAFIQ